MNDDQLLRYSRHILLDELGVSGQEKIINSRVLIIGAGGLGSAAALFLGSSGVGQITICDDDRVDLTNLQRQIIHNTESIGERKVDSAKKTLNLINPEVTVDTMDCSDNFATRHNVNKACVKSKTPLVSGASIKFDGQLVVFDSRQPNSPCYQCLFPEEKNLEETRCAVMGVFSPLVGIIGTAQAAEALKLISGTGQQSWGKLFLFDALSFEWRSIKLNKDPACPVCEHSDA
jgi:molybdopterin/thiamine biosynthesis adenylyltransferase